MIDIFSRYQKFLDILERNTDPWNRILDKRYWTSFWIGFWLEPAEQKFPKVFVKKVKKNCQKILKTSPEFCETVL